MKAWLHFWKERRVILWQFVTVTHHKKKIQYTVLYTKIYCYSIFCTLSCFCFQRAEMLWQPGTLIRSSLPSPSLFYHHWYRTTQPKNKCRCNLLYIFFIVSLIIFISVGPAENHIVTPTQVSTCKDTERVKPLGWPDGVVTHEYPRLHTSPPSPLLFALVLLFISL